MTIISWNVNGIRAAEKKGLFSFLQDAQPDIFCLQETKAHPSQLTADFLEPGEYRSHWSSAQKAGYSGVVIYTKIPPLSASLLDNARLDEEGRGLVLNYGAFVLINTYFPNSQPEGRRLDYKLEFCAHILDYCNTLVKKGENVLLCGDYNIAHKPIDLARPKQNEKNPGYLPEERAWMDSFIQAGYVDTFRNYTTDPGHYTWWSYRGRARENNVGWRLDYHCVNQAFAPSVQRSSILPEVSGSDHCPVLIEVKT